MKFLKFIFFSFVILLALNSNANNCDSLIQTLIVPGPYFFSYIDETDNIRNGPDYDGATIYYPVNSNEQLTSIVLVPGFMNSEETIQNWGPFLASHGFVAMTIGTNSLTNTPQQRKDALLDAIITLKLEKNRFDSPLYNILDTNSMAVGGFSMGGGGAQLAAVSDSTLKAVISLYPFLEGVTESSLNHSSPSLIISGQLDFFANPSQHANIHYNATPNETPKQRYEIQLASHDVISGPNGGDGEVGIRTLAWLKSFLDNEYCYCPVLTNVPKTASEFITNVNCDEIFFIGCTDSTACNYNSEANTDDGSCIYSIQYYNCDGSCLNDVDLDGICDELEVLGCTDILACNYNSEATDEDGSCEYVNGVCDLCDAATGTIIDNDSDDDGICDDDEIETYNCINTACIDPGDNTGIFTSIDECEAICPITEDTWDCIDNSCVSVNDGTGLFSSLEGCQEFCHSSSITKPNKANKKLKKITNLIGQEVKHQTNQPVIEIFDDGSIEKKLIIEK